MSRIDAYASLPHYRDHIEPIWQALDPRFRGVFAGRCGTHNGRWARVNPVIVASWTDAHRVSPRPFVYVEHGSGQSYDGHAGIERIGGYSGAGRLDDCILFLCPNETIADRWRSQYPDTPAVAVGSPRLDVARARQPLRPTPPTSTPVVAFTFHWDCALIPEARSAWAHYARGMAATIAELQRRGYTVVGHGHPRDAELLPRRWARLRVDYWPDSMRVLTEADVLVADNTSLMWEAAAVDMPLVVLDCPHYRRDVEHGLRFWTHADAGVRVDNGADLADAVTLALSDPEPQRTNRRSAAVAVYSGLDGRAASRAVEAIRTVLAHAEPQGPSHQAHSLRD